MGHYINPTKILCPTTNSYVGKQPIKAISLSIYIYIYIYIYIQSTLFKSTPLKLIFNQVDFFTAPKRHEDKNKGRLDNSISGLCPLEIGLNSVDCTVVLPKTKTNYRKLG